MSLVVEELIVTLIKKLVSVDVIKESEESLVIWLETWLKAKDPALLPLVQLVAEALGVPYNPPA